MNPTMIHSEVDIIRLKYLIRNNSSIVVRNDSLYDSKVAEKRERDPTEPEAMKWSATRANTYRCPVRI